MESSGKTTSSAPWWLARRASRRMRPRLPLKSPTVVLICPRAIRMNLYLSRALIRCSLLLSRGHGLRSQPAYPHVASRRNSVIQYANLCVSILRSPVSMLHSLAARAGLLCLVLAPLATVASAQIKIAVVNAQQAMLQSDEIKKVSADLEKKFKPKQDELLQLQKDLESIQQHLSDDTQQEFDRDRQEVLGKAATRMQEIVKKLAEEKGYDLVVDVSQTLY